MPDPVPTTPSTISPEVRALYSSLLELEDKLETAKAAEAAKRTAAEAKLLTDVAVAGFDLSRAPERFKTWQTEDAQLDERVTAFGELLKRVRKRIDDLQTKNQCDVVEVLETRLKALEAIRATGQREAEVIAKKIALINDRLQIVNPTACRPPKR